MSDQYTLSDQKTILYYKGQELFKEWHLREAEFVNALSLTEKRIYFETDRCPNATKHMVDLYKRLKNVQVEYETLMKLLEE